MNCDKKHCWKKIRNNWVQLKENVKPANIAKETLINILQHKSAEQPYGEQAIKHSFTYGVALLAEKLADNAFEKVKAFFKK